MREIVNAGAQLCERSTRQGRKHAAGLGKFALGMVQGVVDVAHSTLQQETYNELRYAASINSVNGCLTRRGMFRALDKMLVEQQPQQVLISYVDIVGFKHINDSCGHAVGDKVLSLSGWGLRKIFSTEETLEHEAYVASWGGDEFVCVLPSTQKMQTDQFGNSLEFREASKNKGEVTWNLKAYEYQTPDTAAHWLLQEVLDRGVSELKYRFAFDAVDVPMDMSSQELIDAFVDKNTIKTATHARRRRSHT
jgi:diguanylate cyclase (GGDEF)-like protein